MDATTHMQEYFKSIQKEVEKTHKIATKARQQGKDPDDSVEVKLAANMAERIVGLISVLAPQIVGSGVIRRIIELEKQYGTLDWRIALKIAAEIAQEKFCKFSTKKEAMEIGIRTGFAYVTNGIVSSPLDGIVNIETKKRMDGKEYVCMNFAGPIRNAGGTAAAVSVLITDYVRQELGYESYDAQPDEVKRAITELRDYHERVTNLQYYPSEEEIEFLLPNMPVEVSGDPSEKTDVSNYKDLPRVPTNKIRSGYCLVLSSCIPLKAPKLWKQVNSWGKEFGFTTWNFLEEFIKIQKKAKAGKTKRKASDQKITPDYTYISDIVAGRPVLGYPLKPGGFRLRYGRGRTSGYSAQSIHPATMYLLNKYIAIGTQLKTERPGKAASMTSCDLIQGPTVKLSDGTVLRVKSMEEAKRVKTKVQEILYLGDTLIAYGDFYDRAHPLIPAGYCAEWWAQEIKKAKPELDAEYIKEPLRYTPKAEKAIKLAEETGTPLHPEYTPLWTLINTEQLLQLKKWFSKAKLHPNKEKPTKAVVLLSKEKEILEVLAIPHEVVNKEYIVIQNGFVPVLNKLFSNDKEIATQKKPLEAVNELAEFKMRDTAGTFIGARMGRPEKAKQRELKGSPHVLFPVGNEGGRLRSFQSALTAGKVTSSFATFTCEHCNKNTVTPVCEVCGKPTKRKWHCKYCGEQTTQECEKHGKNEPSTNKSIEIKPYFEAVLKKLKMKQYPDLIKGVRGTTNEEHIPENLAKGIFRACYKVHVYKDGTTRYDMTQLPITHFKPAEIGTPITKLKELGYQTDIYGKPLTSKEQILEIKPQDVILPNCEQALEEGAGQVLLKLSKFIDDLLEKHYELPKYYNAKSTLDLIGRLVIALAPHTSAGIASRIIGFTQTQGFFAHPLLHAITRRDCDGDEACVILLLDAFLNFSKKYLPANRGSTMDTPLVLTSKLTPTEVDDMAFKVDIAWKYPLKLYEKAQEYAQPWDVEIPQIQKHLGTPEQYEKMGFTHDNTNLNHSVTCSAYKTLPSMQEKLLGQMELAEKLRSVETADVATLVINKHFLRDTKGNLRKFSIQQFRCVNCNEKFRRPPLMGKCTKCNGKIIFTISEGSIVKYLEPTISLATKYEVNPYLKQVVDLLKFRIESVFGKDPERQTGLGAWF